MDTKGLEQALGRERAKLIRQQDAVRATESLIAMIEQQIKVEAAASRKK